MLIAINTTSSYQLYLIKEKTVVNLLAIVSRDVLESTRKAQIDGVTMVKEVVSIGMTNGNIMTFNIKEGEAIKLRSEKLFGQSVLPNR